MFLCLILLREDFMGLSWQRRTVVAKFNSRIDAGCNCYRFRMTLSFHRSRLEKVSSDIEYQNACFFSWPKLSFDPGCCRYRTAASFLLFGDYFNQLAGSQRAKMFLLRGETLLVNTSCQTTSFSDILLAGIHRFPCIKSCLRFFRDSCARNHGLVF